MLNIYTTAELVKLVRSLITSPCFLLDRFFGAIVEHETEEVIIDVIVGKRRIAPFCSPLVAGKVVEGLGYQTKTFKPAYIKDKRVPNLLKPIKRQAGEALMGQLNPEQRRAVNLQIEMADQIDMIKRRLEWMAASALATGTITVNGEGFEKTVINFGRDPDLTVTLSGTSAWSINPSGDYTKPTQDIEEWATLMLQKSGVVAQDIIFTPSAWKAFKKDKDIRDVAIVNPLMNSYPNSVDAGTNINVGGIYKGKWGQFNLWLYNDWFVDPDDDKEKPMLEDGMLLMSGPQLEGFCAFGSIIDPKFNYGAMAYAPKIWTQDDPAQEFMMMQSAPLVIPSRVNASFAARVI
ncbi:major capsid protein (plasmid) [Orbus sturtevantii]|uniref:major capsid protein n=1 Tax=Orbus sturtevantii TaxID=3074109 RepID=UPI00370D0EBE